jgi:hypothetical protein
MRVEQVPVDGHFFQDLRWVSRRSPDECQGPRIDPT